ncbi:hypothetical protein ABZY16_20770 [Streptomyces sp. NPDC006553]|uniref:hypothetical protein n=1 Tax=Streptomyces sp. NPDC006553 TaxID=3157180 RepID=UPI0033A06CB1
MAGLDLGGRYGAKATRVRRGDQDLLAHDGLLLQLDDRVRVAMPRERTAEVTGFLGDTEAKASEVSAVSMGLGLAAGFLIGIPEPTIGPPSCPSAPQPDPSSPPPSSSRSSASS